jgi:hypothetical protein
MNTPTTGRPVLLHTKHFLLRSLKPSDASQRWLSWLKDPEVMDPLNAPVREVPFRDLMARKPASCTQVGQVNLPSSRQR